MIYEKIGTYISRLNIIPLGSLKCYNKVVTGVANEI